MTWYAKVLRVMFLFILVMIIPAFSCPPPLSSADIPEIADRGGIWAEGVIAYLSGGLSEEKDGWLRRKQVLIDYDDIVKKDRDVALKDLRAVDESPAQAIGRGKSSMVFHMLRRKVGDDRFLTALHRLLDEERLRPLSWRDVRHLFEEVSRQDLGWFFDQWVERKGAPEIEIRDVAIGPKGLRTAVSFEVRQKGDVYAMDLPITVKTDRGEVRRTVTLCEKRQRFEIVLDGNPRELIVDEDYDVVRRLGKGEIPPLIGKIFGEGKGLIVLPEEGQEGVVYSDAVSFFEGKGYTKKDPQEVKDSDLKNSAVVVLGDGNPVLRRLYGGREETTFGLMLRVRENPLAPEEVIAVVESVSAEEIRQSLGKIEDYREYSTVVFSGESVLEKSTAESEQGQILVLREPITGFETQTSLTLKEIVERAASGRIVYVGEQHDKYEHHVAQLAIIRELYGKNRSLAIGMEMFQRPFQQALDDFIEGRIDEREFLKSSEYFKRWGFDYTYYKDILRFARDEKIPVVALNIRKEIVSKVSKDGIDSLSAEEKKELPPDIDMTDGDYRERLREVFERHRTGEGRSFDNFYQAQVIWDEIMAQSIAEYLLKNPDRQMIVLAGGGHFAFDSGIPQRTFRRTGLDSVTILNSESVEEGVADYVLVPKKMPVTLAPKLMVMLKEEEGRVRITGFPENSISEKAGIRTDDIILSVDGTKIQTADDIQIFLFSRKQGDTVTVKVLRKRFLLGDREREFQVTL